MKEYIIEVENENEDTLDTIILLQAKGWTVIIQ